MSLASLHSILPEIFASSFAWFDQYAFCMHKDYAIKKGTAKCNKCGTTWQPSVGQFLDKAQEVSRDFANCKHLHFQRTEEYRAICTDCGMHGAHRDFQANFEKRRANCKHLQFEFDGTYDANNKPNAAFCIECNLFANSSANKAENSDLALPPAHNCAHANCRITDVMFMFGKCNDCGIDCELNVETRKFERQR